MGEVGPRGEKGYGPEFLVDLQGPPGVKGDAGNNHNQGERGRGGEQGRHPIGASFGLRNTPHFQFLKI